MNAQALDTSVLLRAVSEIEDPLDKAIAVVSWVDTTIERRIWAPSEIRSKFGKRSAAEILREGHIHYYDPCVDLDSVIAYLMKQIGLQPACVIFRSYERLKVRAYHCVIEAEINAKSYTFIMGKSRKGYILTDDIHRERKDLHRIPVENADIKNIPMFKLMVEGGIENLDKIISGFNYTAYLFWLYATCRKGAFRTIRAKSEKRRGDKPAQGVFIKTISKFAEV